MKPEEIEKLLKLRPFEPFVIRFSDGRQVTIKHPESMVLHRNKCEIGTLLREGSLILDKAEFYSYLHIVSLEILRPQVNENA